MPTAAVATVKTKTRPPGALEFWNSAMRLWRVVGAVFWLNSKMRSAGALPPALSSPPEREAALMAATRVRCIASYCVKTTAWKSGSSAWLG